MSKEHLYSTDNKVKHFSKDEEINVKLGDLIGKKFTEYRKVWDAANRFKLTTEFPLFLQLDMNQNCNLKCPHCIIGDPELTKKYYNGPPLSWDDYKRVVREGEEHGCPSIAPQGNNEPLLLKDFESYVKYAHDHSFIDIMINTNATLLTEARAKKLLDSGLTRLRFSIDAATAETFKKIRVGGNYDKVVRNVERFLSLKEAGGYRLPITGVSFCKMSTNEHELNDFFSYWENKVDIVSVQTFVPPVLEGDFSKYYSSDQHEGGKQFKGFKCPQPFQRITFRNYEMTPCCAMFSHKLKLGDFRRDSIYKAWNCDAMKELRRIHKNGEYAKNEFCKKCVELIFPENSSRASEKKIMTALIN